MDKKMIRVGEKVIPNLWRIRNKQLSATGYFDCYTVVEAPTIEEACQLFNDHVADGYYVLPISENLVECIKILSVYSYKEKNNG